jgi:hypothetical protein
MKNKQKEIFFKRMIRTLLITGMAAFISSGLYAQQWPGASDLYDFLSAIDEADYRYLYAVDGNKVLRDSAGNPLYREMDLVYGRQGDLENWETFVTAEMEKALNRRNKEVGKNGPGSEENDPGLAREYQRIYNLRKKTFLKRRLKDLYSLRRGNEKKVPQEVLERELERMNTRYSGNLMEGIREEAMSGPEFTGVSGNDMGKDIEKEISEWKNVEEEYFRNRHSWEKRAYEVLRKEENQWRRGFSRIEEQKREWEQYMKELFEDGETGWRKAENELLVRQSEQMAAIRGEKDRALSLMEEDLGVIEGAYEEGREQVRLARESLHILREMSGEEGIAEEIEYWEEQHQAGSAAMEAAEEELYRYVSKKEGFSDERGPLEGEIDYCRSRLTTIEKEVHIAKSLLAYAEDQSSNRPREVETEKRFLRAGEKYSTAKAEYDAALSTFTRVLKDGDKNIEASRRRVKESAERLEAAELEYRTAETIIQYASHGYTPEGWEPKALLLYRLEEEKQLKETLSLLESIKEKRDDDFLNRGDREYLDLGRKTKEKEEELSWLQEVSEKMADRLMEVERSMEQELERGFQYLKGFFSFIPNREDWMKRGFEKDNLPNFTDLTSKEMEELSYNADELTKMGASWITGLLEEKHPEKRLSQYGMAFYHETAGNFLSIDDDSTLNTLLDKTDLSADEILQEESRASYGKVKNDPGYGFFKLLLLRDWEGPLLSDQFIRDDLKGLLSREGKGRAKTLIASKRTAGAINAGVAAGLWVSSFFCPWLIPQAIFHSGLAASFYTEADRLEALKDTTKDYSGEDKRKMIVEEGKSYVQKEKLFKELARKWTTITGRTKEGALTAEGISMEGFIRSLSEVITEGIPERIAGHLDDPWQLLRDPDSYPEALAGLMEIAASEGEMLREERDARARLLLAQRDNDYKRYRTLLTAGETESSEYQELVESLFRNPKLTRRDYWMYQWDLEREKGRDSHFTDLLNLAKGELSRGIEHDFIGSAWLADMEKEFFERRKASRQNHIRETYRKGEEKWRKVVHGIEEEYSQWVAQSQKELEKGLSLWNEKYRLIGEGIRAWGKQLQSAVSKEVEEQFVRDVGLERSWVREELKGFLVPDLSSPSALQASKATNASLLKGITEELQRGPGVFLGTASLPFHHSAMFRETSPWDFSEGTQIDTGHIDELKSIRARADHAASLLTRHMAWVVEDKIQERIAEINNTTDRNVKARLLQSGYSLENSAYVREAIIDDTLFGGVETEKHSIEKYRFFIAPSMDLGVDLSSQGIMGLASDLVASRTALAVKRLQDYASLIFGSFKEGSEKEILSEVGKDFKRTYLREAKGFFKGAPKRDRGLIFFHIGYAPEMDPDNSEEVLKEGWGEYGRIFRDFFTNEARLGRGLSTLYQSFYNIRLWDDDEDNDGESDALIKAPNLRSVVDLAMSVASNIIAPGSGFLFNLIDDAGFAFLDAGTGERALGDSLFNVGKKALTGLFQAGLDTGFGNIVTDSLSGLGKAAADTVVSGTQAGLQHLGVELINGFSLEKDSLTYKGEDLASSLFSSDALARISSSSASAFVTSGLTELNNPNGHLTGFSSSHMRDLKEFNSLSGALAGAAVDYGISGETTLNLLNFRELAQLGGFSWFKNKGTGEWYSHGLLEWKVGGKGELSLGSSGVDLGMSRSFMAASGLGIWGEDLKIRGFAEELGQDLTEGMRYLYSFGDEQGRNLYSGLIDHSLGLDFFSDEHMDYLGATEEVDGLGREILLNSGLINGGKDQMLLGVLLQHEAYRDGRVGASNREETLKAVTNHTEMALRIAEDPYYGVTSLLQYPGLFLDAAVYAGDSSFFEEFAGSLYSSEGDFWKLLDNGSIVWDGNRDLRAQGGHLLREDRTQSLSKSLYTYLGAEGAEKVLRGMGISTKGKSVEELAYSLMTGSGAFWDEKQGKYRMMTVAGYKDAPGDGSTLSDVLRFSVDQEKALALGKVPQYSPDISWINQEGENIMKRYGCFFMSVLGAVQSQVGENLLPEEIAAVAEESFNRGYLKDDMFTVDKRGISRLAFEQLGEFKEIHFTPDGEDGTLLIGATGRETVHAREGNSRGEEIFDPYPWVNYLKGGEFKEVRPYSVEDYSPSWEEYKDVRLRIY